MSQNQKLKDLMKNASLNSDATASVVRSGETQSVEVSGTPDLNRYYETGELPTDPLQRKAFQLMIEKGEI